MKLRLLASLAMIAFTACPPVPQPPGSGPDASPPMPDAGPQPPQDACGRAEARLLALGCKDARGRLLGGPTLRGLSWADLCRQNAEAGVPMQPACITLKASCQEIESTCR